MASHLPLMIEWVPREAAPQEELRIDSVAPAPQATARTRPQRAARLGHSVHRPHQLQAALTEERRFERAREKRQMIEKLEQEAQAAEAAVEESGGRKRGRRGGRQVKERVTRREFHALAAMEYVRGDGGQDVREGN